MADVKKDVVSEQDGKGNETKDGQSANENKRNEEKKDETKKDSGFSKWWKGTKAKMDADILEGHIQNAYAQTHRTFDVYNHG